MTSQVSRVINAIEELPAELRVERYRDRADWLEARRQSLGGSDTPKILGLSPWGTPMSVYADKLRLIDEEPAVAEAAEWGLLLEQPIAARYSRETGNLLVEPGRQTIVRNPQYPFLHCTPDKFVKHPTRGLGLLSIKTTSAYKRDEWAEEAPPAYQVQCQHELLVTGLRWTAVAVLIGGQSFRYIDCIERDERFCQRLLLVLETFWGAVSRREPPPVDASEACRQALRALYPKETGETIPLPAELLAADERWIQAKLELDRWQAQKDLAENEFRAAIGSAMRGVLPNGVAWSNKLHHRKEFTVAATDYRKLLRHQKG